MAEPFCAPELLSLPLRSPSFSKGGVYTAHFSEKPPADPGQLGEDIQASRGYSQVSGHGVQVFSAAGLLFGYCYLKSPAQSSSLAAAFVT